MGATTVWSVLKNILFTLGNDRESKLEITNETTVY